jgi:hypothetical protein
MPMDLVQVVVADPQAQTAAPAEREAPGWSSFITDRAKNNQLPDHNENRALTRIDLSV